MESNGKSLILQRTIGAVVLIAAAAILIPLALDGQGLKAGKETVQIPEEPTFEDLVAELMFKAGRRALEARGYRWFDEEEDGSAEPSRIVEVAPGRCGRD